MALSPRFDAALMWAVEQHSQQKRHNTRTPYIGHLLATCAIVLEEQADESLAIAALLHDVLEDTDATRAELRERFGEDVYRIVDDCTDADLGERAETDWYQRKRAHLARLQQAGPDSLLVIAADKVASLQSLADDFIRFGPALLSRSDRSGKDLLDNYREIYQVLRPRLGDRPVVRRLAALLDQVEPQVEG